jgi:capsular exopolysaccharide synthesis family protein
MPQSLTPWTNGQPPAPRPGAPAAGASEPRIDYLRLAWRGKWWILAAMVLGASAGFAWVVWNQPVYRTGAVVELLGTNEGVMGLSLIDPQAGAASNASNVQTQTHILTSRSMLGKVSERVGMELTPTTPAAPGFIGRIRTRLGLVEQEPVAAMKEAIQHAAASIDVRPVGASRLLSISCSSTSPEVAAGFLNALTSEYISQSQQVRATMSSRTTQWLEGQIEEAKNRVEEIDRKLQDFVRKNGLDVAKDQFAAPDPRVQQMQADLAAAQSERMNRQTRYDLAKSSPVESVADVLDDGGLKSIREKLAEVRRERAQLLSVYTPENPRVRRVEAQVAELEAMLNNERAGLLKRLQNDYEAALKREKMMAGAYAAQSRASFGQLDKTAEYAMLKRESDTARQAYNLLLQQMNQSSVVAALPASFVRVIDPALTPITPVSPTPVKDIATASVGGGALVFGLMFLREFLKMRKLRQVFSGPGHAGELLNIRELGVIPSMAEPTATRLLPLALPWKRRLPAGDAVVESDGGGEIASWTGKPSLWTESFRFVVTSVLYGKSGDGHKVLIVSSPGPGEGKTTLVSNLAIASANSGRRVLVIDADIRKPRLHRIFATADGPGLKEVLRSDDKVEQTDLAPYVQQTKFAKVSLLAAGAAEDTDAGDLLFSSRLVPLIARLRQMYDVVLIDTAPALHFSDTQRLGASADGVVLVVRAGQTSRENAMLTLKSLADARIPVVGTVLNDCASDELKGYYAYYGSYSRTAAS